MERARSLAAAYRRHGAAVAATSPLSERVALALGGSDEALSALAAVPGRRRHPAAVLAALHDLALAGRAPALAAAYEGADGDAAARAAVDLLLHRADAVAALVARRPWHASWTAGCAALHPAVAEAAHRAGVHAVGLVAVGRPAGLEAHVDRVGVAYGDGLVRGDASSPVQLSAVLRGDRPVPDHAVPEVVARVRVDRDPLDVTDPDDARWLRACCEPERAAGLEPELAVLTADPALLVRGDVVEQLPAAIARVPAAALPVVTTTWALSRRPLEGRRRLLARLREVAAARPVAWVSVEGVGVAPAVPTLGDRPASGHSLVGVVLLDGPVLRAEAVARCWSRGRLLQWLGDPAAAGG